MQKRYEILDACSLLNLYASQHIEPILSSRDSQCCIVDLVLKESLYVRKPGEKTSGFEYEPVLIDPYIESALIKLLSLEADEEKKLFMDFAANLDDGEAATMALAVQGNMSFVTDDRKAIRVFTERNPAYPCLTTLDLVKDWSEAKRIDPKTLKLVLQNVLQSGNYKPSKNHHLFDWWDQNISQP